MSYFYATSAGASFPAADLFSCPCNDGSGTAVTSTTGPNATMAAGVGWSTTGGGNSIDFPGTETAIVTTDSGITYGTVNTVAFWHYSEDTGPLYIHSNTTLNATNSWNIYSDGQPKVELIGSAYGNRLTQHFTVASANAWHHYAFVIDMAVDTGSFYGSVLLYVDGVSQALGAAETDAKDNDTAATSGALSFGKYTTGFADDIRIWSTALTSGEIAALYAAGRQ
jgi:hypothetical protein